MIGRVKDDRSWLFHFLSEYTYFRHLCWEKIGLNKFLYLGSNNYTYKYVYKLYFWKIYFFVTNEQKSNLLSFSDNWIFKG